MPHDPFDFDDDDQGPRDSIAHADVELLDHTQQFGRWLLFWVVTWGGTTIAGGLFGGGIGLLFIGVDAGTPVMGFLFGLAWAGGVGLLVYLHLGVICWMFWCLGQPLHVALWAGATTGAICGMFFLSIFTSLLGLGGAYWAGCKFLKTTTGQQFEASIKAANNKSKGRIQFTTMDLLLRMAVIAVMIAGWTTWYKAAFSY